MEGQLALPDEVKKHESIQQEEDQIRKIQKENDDYKSKQSKYEEIISQLKHRLENEKKSLKDIKSKTAYGQGFEKLEIKEQFLNCIEEIRKEVSRRRVQNSKTQKIAKAMENRSGLMTSKSNKKTAFSPMSPIADDTESRPKLNSFTAGDKRKVVEMLLSNESVLMKIYENLYTNNSANKKTQLIRKPQPGFFL